VLDDDEDADADLTPDTILVISEEALVLYVKTLAMLNKAMDITGSYWTRHRDAASRASPTSTRLTQVVSWIRDRFNECCIKSELVARKLKQAQHQLPASHPSHPHNLSSGSSATTVGSAENILLTTGVTAEKLMYDRALEMSRQAAIDELTGQNLQSCDINYWTVIQMLDAILEDEETDGNSSGTTSGPTRVRHEADEINGLDGEDRKSIAKRMLSFFSSLVFPSCPSLPLFFPLCSSMAA